MPAKQFIDTEKYLVFRKERNIGKGGGVLIACKRINCIKVIECTTYNTYEEIWLKISYKKQILHLCCVYLSKREHQFGMFIVYMAHLTNVLTEINDERILIVGDHNYPEAFAKEVHNRKSIMGKFFQLLKRFNLKQECKELNNKGNLLDLVITNIKNLNIKRTNQVLVTELPNHIPIIIQSNYMNRLAEAIDNKNNNLQEMENIPLKICQIRLNTRGYLKNWIKKFNDYFPFGFLFFKNIMWPKDNNDDGKPREILINAQTYIELYYSDNFLLLKNKKNLLTYDLSFNDVKTTNFNAFYIKLPINNKLIKLCFLNHRITDGTEFSIGHLEDLKKFYNENDNNEENIFESINILIGDYKSKNKKNHNEDINSVFEELKFLQSRPNVFSNKQIKVECKILFNIINTEQIMCNDLIRKTN